MKPKWYLPFLGTMWPLAYPPPADHTLRWLIVLSLLFWMGVLLAVIQPWKRDDGRDELPRLRVER